MEVKQGKLSGRLGGKYQGINLNCQVEAGTLIRGRIGGRFSGKDVHLTLSPTGDQCWGRIGGALERISTLP